MERSNKTTSFLFIIVLALAGAIYYLLNQPEDAVPSTSTETSAGAQAADAKNNPPQTDNSQTDQTTTPTDTTTTTPTDTAPSPTKETVPPANVNKEPVAFTGFGHQASDPLKLSGNTSTTCTTDANVECSLSFTNTNTNELVTFTPQTTDNTGVTRWEWTGSDVGSGAWNVVATAGNKTSGTDNIETIYIE